MPVAPRYAENFPADDRFEISAATPSIGGPVAKAAAAVSIVQGTVSKRAVQSSKPAAPIAAVGFGGYPSLPAMKAAAMMQISLTGCTNKTAVLGRANRMLVKNALRLPLTPFPLLEKCPAGRAHGLKSATLCAMRWPRLRRR